MTCDSCGRIMQPGARWCLNVGCGAYEVPIVVAEPPAVPRAAAGMRPVTALGDVASVLFGVAALAVLVDLFLPANRVSPVAVLVTVAAALVAFLLWLYRARRNLDTVPHAEAGWPAEVLVLVWLLPVANHFAGGIGVYRVARESADTEARKVRLPKLAQTWSITLGFAVLFRTALKDPDIHPDHGALVMWTGATVVLVVVAAVSGIMMLREVSAAQRP